LSSRTRTCPHGSYATALWHEASGGWPGLGKGPHAVQIAPRPAALVRELGPQVGHEPVDDPGCPSRPAPAAPGCPGRSTSTAPAVVVSMFSRSGRNPTPARAAQSPPRSGAATTAQPVQPPDQGVPSHSCARTGPHQEAHGRRSPGARDRLAADLGYKAYAGNCSGPAGYGLAPTAGIQG